MRRRTYGFWVRDPTIDVEKTLPEGKVNPDGLLGKELDSVLQEAFRVLEVSAVTRVRVKD